MVHKYYLMNSEIQNLNSKFSWFSNPAECIIFVLILFSSKWCDYLKLSWKFEIGNLWKQLKCHWFFWWFLKASNPFCKLHKCKNILIQSQILFIALFYNKFYRPGFDSASVRKVKCKIWRFEHLLLQWMNENSISV